ncbi:MAG: hypothetical protein ACJZ6A_04115 [Candidatus Poseidoniaceae archaeon]
MVAKNLPRELTSYSVVLKLVKRTMHHASVLRNSNSSIIEVIVMSAKFLKVSCRDCSHESIIFSKATTAIICAVCGSILTNPSGGKAQLVGCNVVEPLE